MLDLTGMQRSEGRGPGFGLQYSTTQKYREGLTFEAETPQMQAIELTLVGSTI